MGLCGMTDMSVADRSMIWNSDLMEALEIYRSEFKPSEWLLVHVGVVFARRAHKAADGNPVDGVDRAVALGHLDGPRRQAEAELLDAHAGQLGRPEVA